MNKWMLWPALLLASAVCLAQQPRLETVAQGLEHPWGLAFLEDGRMLVTERGGKLRIVEEGKVGAPIKGLPEIAAGGQGGLLDVSVREDWIYFAFSEPGETQGENSTAVARARLTGNSLSELAIIFRQSPKFPSRGHFGSRLVFAPDGSLFITLGDRQKARDDAQLLDNHHGKVVRIWPDGRVPEDNPFVGKDGALPEIWSYGHRNIQGAAIHPDTGELWIHEHGPQGGDEVNIARAGKNYGWPVISYGEEYGGGKIGVGTEKAGMEQPQYYWTPSIAPSGMTFYTGDAYPQWQGNLFVGALKFQYLGRLSLDGNEVVAEQRLLEDSLDQRVRDVVQGPDGMLYLLTDQRRGQLLRLQLD